jgi:hypothetical protein
LVPRTGNYDEVQDLAKNIFDLGVLQQKKAAIENENASISIVNASGSANFAGKLSALLSKLGYSTNISSQKFSGTAENSIVYDIVKTKPFSLEDISKKFGVQISENLPADLSVSCANADLCLVAGSDLSASAGYEENTTADLEQGYDKQALDERKYIELLKKGTSNKF